METQQPKLGDYCLATKYDDGDPGDWWGLGYYDREENGRHYIIDDDGKQIRHGGFRRVSKIRPDVGAWLLDVASKQLEQSPPGTVNLWTMLTPLAFDDED